MGIKPRFTDRARSAETVRASGQAPQQQAGHMTASDLTHHRNSLASDGPSTHEFFELARNATQARAVLARSAAGSVRTQEIRKLDPAANVWPVVADPPKLGGESRQHRQQRARRYASDMASKTGEPSAL